jgi:hypothetical protein
LQQLSDPYGNVSGSSLPLSEVSFSRVASTNKGDEMDDPASREKRGVEEGVVDQGVAAQLYDLQLSNQHR